MTVQCRLTSVPPHASTGCVEHEITVGGTSIRVRTTGVPSPEEIETAIAMVRLAIVSSGMLTQSKA